MKVDFHCFEGYAYGATQPSVLMRFAQNNGNWPNILNGLKGFSELLKAGDPTGLADLTHSDVNTASAYLCHVVGALNLAARDQRFGDIQMIKENEAVRFHLPTLSTNLTQQNLLSLVNYLNKRQGRFAPDHALKFIEMIRKAAPPHLPRGTNAANFIAAAAARKIPFAIHGNGYLMFGYGSGSTIFDSSITDQEKSIGIGFARSKVHTNSFLKTCGIPVVEQVRIATLDDAFRFADRCGYPVVLKPTDQEQGRGIFANIQNAEDLRFCFESISGTFKNLMIETHAVGHHYRINLMGEAVIETSMRRAASVIGDGSSTLRVLIGRLNQEPERLDPNSAMKPVTFDADLERSLKNQGTGLQDIPEAGQSIYLRSITNGSRGGTKVFIDRADVHKENYELCFAVARAMRIEIAGIDVISPDISQPWYSNGAVICEVNAKPQLGKGGTEIFWNILKNYLGRAPTIRLMVSDAPEPSKQFLYDTQRSDITVNVSAKQVLRHGCPTQYFDALNIDDSVSDADRARLKRLMVSVPLEDVADA